MRRRPAFDATVAAARFEPPFDQVVRNLKYAARLHEAPMLGALAADRWAAWRPSPGLTIALRDDGRTRIDVIVPVPLSRERLARRGFNQSLEIARAVARPLRTPLDPGCVLRILETAPQASLRLADRRRNLRGAFVVPDAAAARLRGRSILVIDDVMTTGATLDELARTLKRAGTASVVNLVVARTP